ASASPALMPVTDDDPLAAGHQLLAGASGAVQGYVTVGTASGLGGATVTAERGTASATAPVRLLANTPSGAIALSAPADSVAADSAAILSIGASGLHDAGGNAVPDGEKYTV